MSRPFLLAFMVLFVLFTQPTCSTSVQSDGLNIVMGTPLGGSCLCNNVDILKRFNSYDQMISQLFAVTNELSLNNTLLNLQISNLTSQLASAMDVIASLLAMNSQLNSSTIHIADHVTALHAEVYNLTSSLNQDRTDILQLNSTISSLETTTNNINTTLQQQNLMLNSTLGMQASTIQSLNNSQSSQAAMIASLNKTISSSSSSSLGSIPIGSIILWSSTTIPPGFALCDGTRVGNVTTPNLSGQFVVGVGTNSQGSSYQIGSTSGQDNIQVYPVATYAFYQSADGNSFPCVGTYTIDGTTCSTQFMTSVYLSGTDNRPSFYALAYIMRVQ